MPLTFSAFAPADKQAFKQKYKNFAQLVDRPDLGLWAELNNEAAFSLMRAATVALDLPAVAGISKLVAPVVLQAAESERDFIKQGIGAIVCFIMESNGYRKTDTKRSVPGKLFNRGEVYAEA